MDKLFTLYFFKNYFFLPQKYNIVLKYFPIQILFLHLQQF